MFKTGNYKIGFDIWGLTLFLAIMLPNFIWFAVPAVNDECASVSLQVTRQYVPKVLETKAYSVIIV